MRMLSHSEGLGILILTKDDFGLMLMFAKVNGHFVPKSFRTQVIKYLFGHFVPITYPFRTHVISLPLWSVNSNLVTKFQKWLRNVIPFWSFRTFILLILYPFLILFLAVNSMHI